MVKKNGYVLRGERTREKILNAAKKVFSEKGYKEATVALIAERAGVGYGTVYAHFGSGKDEVLLDIMEDIMGEFYLVASVAYTPNSKEEAYHFTSGNITQFLELAQVHREWLALFYEAFGQSERILAKWEEISDRFIDRISENVEIVKAKGLSRNPDYDARIVAGTLYYPGEKFLWKIALGKTTAHPKEIARNIAEVYTNGLFK
ncbi:TetR/AcrR family transcriptional regulator [Planomicrobium chinense]|nr:TetR/AcrR family transcriptional regulator [Planococcus chinensis]